MLPSSSSSSSSLNSTSTSSSEDDLELESREDDVPETPYKIHDETLLENSPFLEEESRTALLGGERTRHGWQGGSWPGREIGE